MAKITYLDNCGFVVRAADVIIVFDYYRDPAHALDHIIRNHPELPVVFFVSSSRKGHFNPEIFNLAQDNKRLYVLANDVLSHVGDTEVAAVGLSAGDRVEDITGGLTVEAFEASEAGISFLVTTSCGAVLFHGGDLSPRHYDVTDTRKAERMASQFTITVHRIAAAYADINLAFLEVDPRLGKDFAKGAAEFVDTLHVDNFIPMHMEGMTAQAGDFRNYPVDADTTTHFHCFQEVGQTLSVKLPAVTAG